MLISLRRCNAVVILLEILLYLFYYISTVFMSESKSIYSYVIGILLKLVRLVQVNYLEML